MSANENSKNAAASNADPLTQEPGNLIPFKQSGTKPEGKEPLSELEAKLLDSCVQTLKSELGKFWVIGNALRAIREQKLFRIDFDNFEAYCRDEWGMCHQYACRQINAAECMDKLKEANSPIGEQVLPANESQVRPLIENDLTPKEQIKAWQQVLKASKDKKITAALVAEVVDKLSGKSGGESIAKTTTANKHPKNKLNKIAEIATKALKNKELTVVKLKKALETIQKLSTGKPKAT